MAVQTQIQTRRGTAASWTSTNPTLAAGEIGFETDTGKFKIGNGSTAWAALAYSAGATAVTYLFNATSGQTTFSGADANGLTLAYTVGAEQVYLNGVLQVRGSDYTATNGTSIVLASGALTSDVLNVIAYSAMTITDTYTQAQADAKFVQQTNNFFAGKNKIINGDFYVNQRGFTSTTTTGTYTFDRWKTVCTDGTVTYSAQTFTPGAAPVAGYEGANFMQVVTSGQTLSSARANLLQSVENVRNFAGQTVTVSFWAKAATGTPSIAVELTQIYGAGGSSGVNGILSSPPKQAITTSWARYSYVIAVPSVSGKTLGTSNTSELTVSLWLSGGSDFNARTGSIGIQSNTFQIWGVQIEAGSVATPFQTATGTIAGELAACQRYYQRAANTSTYAPYGYGTARTTTQADVIVSLPVSMRVAPTAIDYSTLKLFNPGVASFTLTSITIDSASNTYVTLLPTTSGTLTQYRSYSLGNDGATGYLGFTAEL